MVAYGLTVKAAGGLLRDVPALPGLVRADRREPGGDRGDRGGQRLPQAAEGRAGGLGVVAVAGAGRVPGGSGSGGRPGDTLTSDWLGERAQTGWPSASTRSGRAGGCRPGCSPRPGANGRRRAIYLMVLSAHAGLAYLAAAVVARDLYRRGYSRVQGGRTVAPADGRSRSPTRSSTASSSSCRTRFGC